MFRVLSGVILFVAVLSALVWVFGYFSDPYYEGELKEYFVERRPIVWQSLTNAESFAELKRDVKDVTVLESDNGLIKWKEDLKGGGYRIYQILERKNPYRYIVELEESSYGLVGKWEFFLSQSSDGTLVEIKEESTTDNIWIRGINTIRGKDVNLKNQLKVLRVALFRRLIDSP